MPSNLSEAQTLFEREKSERRTDIARAETSTVRMRRYVPADGVLEVPSRWVIISHEFFDIDDNAEVVLGADAAIVVLS